jgi:hypothetical protein
MLGGLRIVTDWLPVSPHTEVFRSPDQVGAKNLVLSDLSPARLRPQVLRHHTPPDRL